MKHMHTITDSTMPCLYYRVAEWESRYRARESKPEDLELISELRILTQQQKQRIKDLIVSLDYRASVRETSVD